MKRLLLLTAILLTGCATAGFGNLDDIIASTPILFSKTVSLNADEMFYCVETRLRPRHGQQFSRSVSPDKSKGMLTIRAGWVDAIWILDDGVINVRATNNQFGGWKQEVKQVAQECSNSPQP
jgi:hypothetical protein